MPVTDLSAYLDWRERFAVDASLYTLDYLDYLVTEGRGKFWSTPEAAIVAEVKTYPTGAKVIHGLVAAGELSEITGHLIPVAEAWAKEHGCVYAIIESREGWMRQLRGSGYEPFQVSLRKAL
jgi:hypothetical protein